MRVAYISHHGRPCYELDWLSRLPVDEVKIIDTSFDHYSRPASNKIKYCPVQFRTNRWLNRLFGSTAAWVEYDGFEAALQDVDVIIVLELFSSLSRQFVEYARRVGKKVWVLVYELIPNHPIYFLPPYRKQTKIVGRLASGIICVSQQAERHLKGKVPAGCPRRVVYPGVDIAAFQDRQAARAVGSEDRVNILFLAKTAPHKGIVDFIHLAERHGEADFTVAGDGPQAGLVREAAARLDNLNYLGRIDHAKVADVMRQHNIYVMPAVDTYKFGRRIGSEQFGFSLVEAMAAGMAVLTTDCGAIAEIVTSNNSIVAQHDFSALDRALTILLRSPDKIKNIGQRNAKLAAERFDIDKQAQCLAEVVAQ